MLSGFQKKVSGAAIACLSICVIAAFVVLIFVLLGKFLGVFGAVVLPVIVALIASFIISPIVDFISSKLRIGRTWACILAFAIILAFMAIISIFALPALAGEIARMFASIPEAFHNVAVHLTEKFPNAKDIIIEKLTELKNFVLSEISVGSVMSTLRKISLTASAATGGIMAVCTYLTAIAVTPIYLYYMLTENADFFGRVERNLNFLDKSLLDDILFMLRRFTEIMTTFFRGQLTIALIMGALFGTGLFLAGVKFGFLLGFAAGMLNIIPYFGTMVGLSTILPVAAFQDGGGIWLVAASLAIFAAVQMVEGYLLTPKIMGDRTGLHPTVIIFSVFFWGIALGGIQGMILAIPLTAFIVALWQRILQRIKGRKV